MWGAYYCMSAYKHNVAVVIKMGAYIHWGAYYPDFTVSYIHEQSIYHIPLK